MRKLILLLLLLISITSYGQAEFPEGVQITGGQPTATSSSTLTATDGAGLQVKVAPENILLNVSPHPINYSVTDAKLGSHLIGIDNKIGTIVATTAGITTRINFTADQTTISAGTFYLSNAANKGVVTSAIQSLTNNDNEKKYFTTDVIGSAFLAVTPFPAGVYSGQLTCRVSPNSAAQRYTVEIYKTNNGGTPIASGVTGAPTGSLGVTVVAILDSGIINLADGAITGVPISGSLIAPLSIGIGERIRYHVSAQKVGTAGASITMDAIYGSDYNSYYDVPVVSTTDNVQNKSLVVGATTTDALNTLNGVIVYKKTISEIRLLSGTLPSTNFYTTDTSQEGSWRYDSTDTTSADNTGTILVTSDGKRIKRAVNGAINVLWFGAKGDGSNNDTSSIQSAVNAVGSDGGEVIFPAGKYQTTGNINIPRTVKLTGQGGTYSYDYTANVFTQKGSIIFCSSATNDLFYSSASGHTFKDLSFVNNSVTTPTAGKGLNLLNAGFVAMDNVSVFGFYDNMDLINSGFSAFSGCHFWNAIRYNVYMENPLSPDSGDNAFVNCSFSTNTTNTATNIKWKSGGGLKISNSKFNPAGGGRTKIHLDVECTGTTSILLLEGNSMEGFEERAVKITSDGTHHFGKIIINGNQMESYASVLDTYIEIQGNGKMIRDVNIVGNFIMRGGAPDNNNPAILLNDMDQVNLSGNFFSGFAVNKEITNTPLVYDFDAQGGGTVRGNINIGNYDGAGLGWRSISNKGVGVGTNLNGILIETNLTSADGDNLNLIIKGNSASANPPIDSNLQLAPNGAGTIGAATILNKGLAFSDARAFYTAGGKLVIWVKPTQNYSNFNFEILSNGYVSSVIDNVTLGALPSGRTGEVVFSVNDIPASGSYTPTLTAGANIATLTRTNASYTRVGNILTATVGFEATVTLANVSTAFTITLPVSRTTTTSINIGSGSYTNYPDSGSIFVQSNSTTVTSESFIPTTNLNTFIGSVTFQYSILD